MNLNIDYEHAIDFETCHSLQEAVKRMSEITNVLNRIIIIRQYAKRDILEACSRHKGENFSKLSFENKMVKLSEISGSSDLANLWQEADAAYRQVKNKQDQVFEEINAFKKMIDVTPR